MKLYIQQKVFSWRDRFSVKDADGADRYYAEGEVFSLGKQLHIYNSNGHAVAHIRQKLMSFTPKFEIEINGQIVCEIVRKFTILDHDYYIDGLPWYLEGDFWGHDYSLINGNQVIMRLSKQWFTWGDSYLLNILNPEHELKCLCIALAVDCALAVKRRR